VSGLDAIWVEIHGRESEGSLASDGEGEDPWPEEVDGAVLIEAICMALERFIIASRHAIFALALWVLHTHAHDAASKSPILLIWGPMPDCGKSTALDVVSRLVANVLRGTGLTLAYVLRKAQSRTVCWDEIDKEFRKKGQNIDGWFTCGYQRGRIFGRCEGDANEPTDYDPWCPKAIAMIGKPWDEQVLSRCIPIEMRRKLEGEEIEEYYDTEPYRELDELRRMAGRWSADHLDRLRASRPQRPPQLRGTRPFDNWRPLFAIADAIGGDWPERARAAAVAPQTKNEHDRTAELLRDLRDLFAEAPDRGFWMTEEILSHLKDLPEREYESMNRGRPITGKWLANQLAAFGIQSDQPRINGKKTKRGYHAAHFGDVFSRYLVGRSPSDPSDPSDPRPAGSDGSEGSDGKGPSEHESQPSHVPDTDPTVDLF
jgi:hypothetical protein